MNSVQGRAAPPCKHRLEQKGGCRRGHRAANVLSAWAALGARKRGLGTEESGLNVSPTCNVRIMRGGVQSLRLADEQQSWRQRRAQRRELGGGRSQQRQQSDLPVAAHWDSSSESLHASRESCGLTYSTKVSVMEGESNHIALNCASLPGRHVLPARRLSKIIPPRKKCHG